MENVNMQPYELVHKLRRISASIDNSQSPSRELVVKDLKQILSSLADDTIMLYTCLAYTGPGKTRFLESFLPFDNHVQTHRVNEKEIKVDKWFADLVKNIKSESDNQSLIKEAKKLYGKQF